MYTRNLPVFSTNKGKKWPKFNYSFGWFYHYLYFNLHSDTAKNMKRIFFRWQIYKIYFGYLRLIEPIGGNAKALKNTQLLQSTVLHISSEIILIGWTKDHFCKIFQKLQF